jgi:hypothetical protein
MSYTNKIAWENLRTITAPFTGSYQAFTALAHPAYKLKLVNNSTSLVTVSFNGADDFDVAPANSFWLYDESIIGQNGQLPAVPQGTIVSIKGTAGTGSVYLVAQYIIQQ